MANGQRCELCQLPLKYEDAVVDHCHDHGGVRGVLHRGCNSLLGKIENNYKRFGITFDQLCAMLHQTASYLQKNRHNITGLIYPTHKTAEEKYQLKLKKARDARAAKKKAT